MIVDLEGKEGEWFTFFNSKMNERGEIVYDEPAPDAGRVQIRSLVTYFEQARTNQKRKYEWVLNTRTKGMERVGYFDDPSPEEAARERDDAYDYAITGIENIFDREGKPVECTRENKLKLMNIPAFNRFIARCLQLLADSYVKSGEEERKNG